MCGRACACGADSRQILKGSHPGSASGRLGERWREARTEHETDRKQIGPEPVAINHHRRARPSHSSHMHATHRRTFTHTNMHSRKWNVATGVKSPTANTPGNRREKNHSSYFFFFLLPPTQVPSLKQPCLLALRQDKRRIPTIPNTHVHKRVEQWALVRVKGELAFIMKDDKGVRAISEQSVTHLPTFLHCYIRQKNFKEDCGCWPWFESNKIELTHSQHTDILPSSQSKRLLCNTFKGIQVILCRSLLQTSEMHLCCY